MKTLKCPPVSKPFAINKQYKSNLVEKPSEQAEEPDTVAEPPAKKAKSGPHAKAQAKKASSEPWDYGTQRSKFIRELRDGGMSFSDASQKWNDSDLKKSLLGKLTVSELIRRRFLEKGSKENPWS